jgi:hypothetical protein
MVAVSGSLRDLVDARICAAEHIARLERLPLPAGIVDGYLHARAGAHRLVDTQ